MPRRLIATSQWPLHPGRNGWLPQIEYVLNISIGSTHRLYPFSAFEHSPVINDDEPGLHEDYKRWLEKLAPFSPSPEVYHHNRTGEDNGDAHHKRQVMGREVVVAVTDGQLDFGTWERIFYGEFDGRRAKRILIKIIGD